MSFVKRNYIDYETVVTAENLNDIQDAIIQIVPDDVKQALLQIASKVAYIDEQGQDYYDALESALYPDASLVSISAVYTQSGTVYDTDSLDSLKADLVVTAVYADSSQAVVTTYTLSGTLTAGTSTITVSYGGKTTTFNVTVTHQAGTVTITNTLNGCTNSNSATSAAEGDSYSATITASSGYSLTGATVSVTMGNVDITSTAYNNGVISIASLTGNLVITITAVLIELVSISAVYTQSGTVYNTDSLDSLKADLVVTATYSDSSTETIPSTDYTLSGTLEVGTSTIIVAYGGKTTTFDVTVSAPWWSLEWTKADGGFPYSVDATHWKKAQQTSDISFVTNDGIRINGTSGIFSCYPTGHETSSSSTYEIKCKFATMPTVNGIIVRLGNGTIGMQVTLGNGGISMDNGATLISGVSITTGVDYIVKAVCDTSGTCYVYLDGVQIWSGSASAIGNKKNYVMMTTASSSIDAYISEIRFGL